MISALGAITESSHRSAAGAWLPAGVYLQGRIPVIGAKRLRGEIPPMAATITMTQAAEGRGCVKTTTL
jgi:hypothetical protein